MLLACDDLKVFGLNYQDFPKPCVSAGDTLYILSGARKSQHTWGGETGLRRMEDAFMASEVDSEPLTIDKTVFRHSENDNVEDIPGLMDMPRVIRDSLIRCRSEFANDLSASRKTKCEPLHLTVKEGVKLPPKCRRARLTAHHWRPRAKAKVVTEGILIKVDGMMPVVSALSFVKKPHAIGIRFVADYTGVNKTLERPPHHFPAPQVCGRGSPQAQVFHCL